MHRTRRTPHVRLARNIGATLLLCTVTTAIFAPVLARFDPFAFASAPLSPPSLAHPMGTDAIGRDLLSGVLHGARTSLLVATAASTLTCLLGAVIGLLSGYAGGFTDTVLMRITELFQTIPRFFLVVLVVALLGPGLDRVVVVIGITSWTTLALVVRAETIALRDLEFVVAARAGGSSALRVLWRHLLPNIVPGAAVLIGLAFGQALLVEASIGFLGLADPNALSWGALAGQAQGYLRVAWWLSVFPGLAIASAVLGVNLLADSIVTTPGFR